MQFSNTVLYLGQKESNAVTASRRIIELFGERCFVKRILRGLQIGMNRWKLIKLSTDYLTPKVTV